MAQQVSIDEAMRQAFAHHQAGRAAEAEKIYRQVLAADPRHFHALQLLGIIALHAGQPQAALELIGRALQIDPSPVPVRANYAYALRAAGRIEDAVAEADRAIALDPAHRPAHVVRAAALTDLRRLDEAVAAWKRVIELAPDAADGYANLGNTYEIMARLEEALSVCRRAVELDSKYATGHHNLAAVLAKQGRFKEAMEEYGAAIELDASMAPAWVNLAFALQQLGLVDRAVIAARRGIELNPNDPNAYRNLACALHERGETDAAADAFEEAIYRLNNRAAGAAAAGRSTAKADRELIARLRMVAAGMLPPIYDDLDHLERSRKRLIENVERLKADGVTADVTDGEAAPTLFDLAYQGRDDRAINATYATLVKAPQPVLPARGFGAKIRIGLISSFFRNHTIGRLNQGLIAELDRQVFEVTVLSVGQHDDDVSRYLRAHCDHFVILPQIVAAARDLVARQRLDVLFYTDLGMDPITYALAFSRLARVQCVTWGHPVTTGIPTIDYFISADAMETPGSEARYSERLVRLAHPAVYYFRPPQPTGRRTRADFGLPEDATLYGCLQMLWKFHPEFDALLAGVLRGDPRGTIIITEGLSALWQERLMARFRRSMPDVADRVRFVLRQSFVDFLGLTSVCDVMLDPMPFGGGNTTYEALAFGVPVVTLPAQLLRGRITSAMYEMMDYRELVARSPQEYIDTAVKLGADRGERERVRGEINSRSSALFENGAGVRELEKFLERAVRDAAPPRAGAGRDAGAGAGDSTGG